MTSVNISTKLSTTKFLWTTNGLIISYVDHKGSKGTMEVSQYLDLIESIRSGLIFGMQDTQLACAYAMVLAAKSLKDSDNKYYSNLLKICLDIETINKNYLSAIVKRMLAAGDDADGPANGKDMVVKNMVLEANLIQSENIV